jgi:hypothetical protein
MKQFFLTKREKKKMTERDRERSAPISFENNDEFLFLFFAIILTLYSQYSLH